MTHRQTGPACGNNPNYRMSEGDRQAVADFKEYLANRAAVARVRTVLEKEAVVGRSALEYRGLIASALMAGEEQPAETQDKPAELSPVCEGFQWIGQSFATCDRCGQPAWDHQGEDVAAEGAGPFENRRTVRLWKPGEADRIRAKWGTPAVGEQPDTQTREARS